ncbi:sugar phosphate isomerase/epimerase and 4-hydroxyphenylpyruvate domain-containing protein [Acrocarpospora macrocephala]|uniref:3-dehydroshikimate dehydratase n=1 Tax=Acrocarpospora macrocephala TaxID=150177 RepID=A0A5M3XE77_9ACTN|nr:sugar phosphate isomerase/epimerase and 4-hydroxyphenylpyruvate domain-containing protein [Acrocarpospora macrocephala]GES16378.1 4-hydroxyphenylpyruvate dioxygenase [Acrocarpospora macrocephala]
MRTSIATVSVGGTLAEKLTAIAAAGFDGVEIFENDLLASPMSPAEVRVRAADLGLSIDLYQPFRDFEAMPADLLAANLRRADHKFRLMRQLGADLLLVCSNVSPAAIGSDELAAEQLRSLASLAAEYGIRIAYEALAWGRHVDDYLHAWRIVHLADHPNLGTCLDSFHILSRGFDPIGIEAIPGEKIFFVQLADAPILAMDVLQWSRHYRCFPGQGMLDVRGLVGHVLRAGYSGPLSLEVFNDVFRQADAGRTALDGMRSLIALGLPEPVVPTGLAFAELAVADPARLGELLAALGFVRTDAQRWEQGAARIVLRTASGEPELAAIGLESPDPDAALTRARTLRATVLPGEHAIAAPDGTQIVFCPPTTVPRSGHITHIDHVALTQPWHHFDEAALFYRSVLALCPQPSLEVPDPYGLLRSRAMSAGPVRMVLNITQVQGIPTQHIALACDDLVATARALPPDLLLEIPANYHDDLDARYDLPFDHRALGIMYDRDDHGEFLHLYTITIGRVFFELVQRVGGYQGYGAVNAPVRLAVQHSRGPMTPQ